jgi:sugar lactone lactonase YvrE
MEHCVAAFEPTTGALDVIAEIESDKIGNRVNDAKCDSRGRFWVGTMAYDWQTHRGAGSLYRVDPDGSVLPALTGVSLSNGLAWSPDDATFYYVDSATQRIDQFAFDADAGRLANRRSLCTVPAQAGVPDGLTIDADGYLWLALWGGGALWRIEPLNGVVDRVITLPVTQVTSCAFGGPDLSDLYVTSAAVGLSQSALSDQPLAGGLFRIRPGVTGRPTQRFAR